MVARRTGALAAGVAAVAAMVIGIGVLRDGEPPAEVAKELAGAAPAEAVAPGAVQLAPEQKECLAQAVYHEARGEPDEAKKAVAAVVLNRMRHDEFPDSVCGVVRQGGEAPPCQFSWWCDGRSDQPKEPEAWQEALRVAEEVARDPNQDPTQGALYFHREDVHPDWSKEFRRLATIGRHHYYAPHEDVKAAADAPPATQSASTEEGK